MFNRKQLVVIGSSVLLMGVLLSLEIKGLVKPGEEPAAAGQQAAAQPVKEFTLEEVSETSRQTLNASLNKQISDLEARLRSASGSEKAELHQELARQWDDVNVAAPAAYYYELIAEEKKTYDSWLKAGDRFTDAYQQTMDTLMMPVLVQKAIRSYESADKIKAGTPEVKIGLGVAYVNGTANPMQGIQLLLDVVKNDPKNLKANLHLGLFSMKSGQYDKAVERFKTVVEEAEGSTVQAEAWFYMASSYENMGMKPEAIGAYLKTKEVAADPNMSRFVDRKVTELSN